MSDRTYIERLRRSLGKPRERLDYPFLRSAVIVPLQSRNGQLQILLELRAEHLRRSPGEVGFPGGRIEPGESPWEAALRELEEELGVDSGEVECLGQLPEQMRRRDELIVPFVGQLSENTVLEPDGVEVAEVFHLPMDLLLEAEFREAQIVERYALSDDFPRQYLPGGVWEKRVSRPVHYLVHEHYLIWGLSAAILRQLRELLR